MKKILVLCYEYPPLGGGGGRVAAKVASALRERGNHVRVITGGMSHLSKRSMTDEIEVIRVRSGRRCEESCSVVEMFCWVLAAFPVALREAWSWKPDVMHIHFAVPTGFVACLLHLLTRIPYVLTVHLGDVPGGVPEQTQHLFRVIKPFTVPIWRAAAKVTAVSNHVAALAEKAYGIRPQVILNGVHLPKKWNPKPPRVPKLLMVGRLSLQKNPLLAIQALALLRDLPWQLQIIGEGPLSKALRSSVLEHQLQERVLFSGWLEEKKVKTAMEDSDILLMPSLSEGLPVVGVEALAQGLAIVGSRIGGLEDILNDGENGYFFDLQKGAESMAAALAPLLKDRNLLQQFQEASHHLAERFEWNHSIDAYEEVLDPFR